MFQHQNLHGPWSVSTSKSSVKLVTAYLLSSFALLITANMFQDGDKYNLQPFIVDLSSGLPHMLDLINRTELPHQEEYPGVTAIQGITLQSLATLRDEWVDDFEWEEEEASMNK